MFTAVTYYLSSVGGGGGGGLRFAFIWFEQYGARIARWSLFRQCSFLVFWVLGSVGVWEAV